MICYSPQIKVFESLNLGVKAFFFCAIEKKSTNSGNYFLQKVVESGK